MSMRLLNPSDGMVYSLAADAAVLASPVSFERNTPVSGIGAMLPIGLLRRRVVLVALHRTSDGLSLRLDGHAYDATTSNLQMVVTNWPLLLKRVQVLVDETDVYSAWYWNPARIGDIDADDILETIREILASRDSMNEVIANWELPPRESSLRRS